MTHWKKEPMRLTSPSTAISCVVSMVLEGYNDWMMAMLSRIAMNGNTMTPTPTSDMASMNVTVLLSNVGLNGGGPTAGKPGSTKPGQKTIK